MFTSPVDALTSPEMRGGWDVFVGKIGGGLTVARTGPVDKPLFRFRPISGVRGASVAARSLPCVQLLPDGRLGAVSGLLDFGIYQKVCAAFCTPFARQQFFCTLLAATLD